MKNTIGFIGCGNMAQAMMGGLIRSGLFEAQNIITADPSAENCQKMHDRHGITVAASNRDVAEAADYLVLAVKPYIYSEVLREIAGYVKADAIVIVIAVGIEFEDVKGILGDDVKVVRTQPSTPAFVLESDSTICPDNLMTQEDIDAVMAIFNSFGKTEILPEKLMNVVPAIASSAPAYTMLFIEAMADGGVYHGFPRDQAYRLAAQSVYGAAKLVLESGEHPAVLKDQICTPGGTTIEAVKALEDHGFRKAVLAAVDACAQKSKAMLQK